METNHDEFLERIAKTFPNKGIWRWLDDKGNPKTKGYLLVTIGKMRKAEIPDKDIATMLEDLFFAAYVEHERQVKESTGLTVRAFYEQKKALVDKGQPVEQDPAPVT